ncbi:MAG: hypothetical protein ACE5G6_03560 [Terriglobia bacterium]
MRRRYKILGVLLAGLLGLAGALAWRLHTWGRPLPVSYRRVAVTPATPGGPGRSFTYLKMSEAGSPSQRIVEVDSDGDGTIDLVLTEGRSPASFNRPLADDPDTRWLILCLDGVPYSELFALWEEGYFREFFRPVPLISPFPSASGPALTSLFHTPLVPGYEDKYFDRAQNRMAGGALKTTRPAGLPYQQVFDYDLPGYLRGPAYLLPVKSYRAELGRLRKRFLASHQSVYIAHLATTDSLHHVVPEKARRLLREVDSWLRELYLESEGKLRLTVLSDHGNSLTPARPVPLEEFLPARGWRLRDRLEGPRDVVVPAYGLVGFLAVYCRPEARADLAADLAEMEGADLVVYAEDQGVVIESVRGRARLEWNPDGTAFRYQPQSGDPLALADTLENLAAQGKVGPEGWVQDADLFAATAHHRYPDPGHRLWQWATNHVENRADIIVSLQPGYFYGSGAFRYLVDILSTHGSLDRAQSLGFAMTTDGPLPGPVRSWDLLPADLKAKSEKRK